MGSRTNCKSVRLSPTRDEVNLPGGTFVDLNEKQAKHRLSNRICTVASCIDSSFALMRMIVNSNIAGIGRRTILNGSSVTSLSRQPSRRRLGAHSIEPIRRLGCPRYPGSAHGHAARISPSTFLLHDSNNLDIISKISHVIHSMRRNKRRTFSTFTKAPNATTSKAPPTKPVPPHLPVNMIDQDGPSIPAPTIIETAALECRRAVNLATSIAASDGINGRTEHKATKSPRDLLRTSAKTASEQLLNATNSTNLLLDQIKQIREENTIGSEIESTTNVTSRKRCVQELHRAFLGLVQCLLDCIDNAHEDCGNTVSDDIDNDTLVSLVLRLSYRAHQLQLWFHRPLYSRIAVTLANQKLNQHRRKQHILPRQLPSSTVHPSKSHLSSPLSSGTRRTRAREKKLLKKEQNRFMYVPRSRIDWIWTIHKWSRDAWNEDPICSSNSANKDSRTSSTHHVISQEDLDWLFYPCLVSLGNNGEWSDLSYLLHGVLLSSNSDQKKSYTAEKTTDDSPTVFLNESLVRVILSSIQRHGFFPSIWDAGTANAATATYGSETKIEILGILMLMEPSIWKIFGIDLAKSNNPVIVTSTDQTNSTRRSTVDASSREQKHYASLRDAIEALLETTQLYNTLKPTHDEEGFDDNNNENGDDDDDYPDQMSFAKSVSELEDLMLGVLVTPENDDDNSGWTFSLSLLPDQNSDSQGEIDSRRIWKYKHVVGSAPTIRLGKQLRTSTSSVNSIPEIETSDAYDWEHLRNETQRNENDDSSTDDFSESQLVYSRTNYDVGDEIPDMCSFLFEHNGKRTLRYRPSMERDILDQFYRCNGYEDEDDDDEFWDE